MNGAPVVPLYVLDLVRSVTTGEPLDFHRHQVPTLIRDALTEAFSPGDLIGDGVTEAEHLERVERQRDAALAAIERVRALADVWATDFEQRDHTYDDRDDRADSRDDCATDIRAALEGNP